MKENYVKLPWSILFILSILLPGAGGEQGSVAWEGGLNCLHEKTCAVCLLCLPYFVDAGTLAA